MAGSSKSVETCVEDLREAAEARDGEAVICCVGHLAVCLDQPASKAKGAKTAKTKAKKPPAFDETEQALQAFAGAAPDDKQKSLELNKANSTVKPKAGEPVGHHVVPQEVLNAALELGIRLISWLRSRYAE